METQLIRYRQCTVRALDANYTGDTAQAPHQGASGSQEARRPVPRQWSHLQEPCGSMRGEGVHVDRGCNSNSAAGSHADFYAP